jgi:hypothetical protein
MSALPKADIVSAMLGSLRDFQIYVSNKSQPPSAAMIAPAVMNSIFMADSQNSPKAIRQSPQTITAIGMRTEFALSP